MKDFADKIAVVTGGASGVGRALGARLARAGMKVVLADVEALALERTAGELARETGADVSGVVCDVTRFEAVEALARAVVAKHGRVHVLCNNAGVGAQEDAPLWELPLSDWRWTFAVNVWGVIHGIKAFLPGMLAHGEEGHVMNTSSGNGGLVLVAGTPVYSASKAAVSAITETLHLQLVQRKAKLHAHVLYPGPHIVDLEHLRRAPQPAGRVHARGAAAGAADHARHDPLAREAGRRRAPDHHARAGGRGCLPGPARRRLLHPARNSRERGAPARALRQRAPAPEPGSAAVLKPGVLAPLCGHDPARLREDGYRLRCGDCGSFFDRDAALREFHYDASYPVERDHFDPEVGAMKVRSLERWLGAANLDPTERVVCEVGFGGGHCLRWLAERAALAFGIEAVEANLEHARGLGLANLVRFADCREPLSRPVELWLFLDSFEHLPDPARFLRWLVASSAPGARVLVVAPEAGSPSERWLGPLWPHRLPDHRFHWSRDGLAGLYRAHGFRTLAEFQPTKTVSGAMLVNHLTMTLPLLRPLAGAARSLRRLRLNFNVGEMGLVLEREATGAATIPTPVHPS